MNPTWSITQNAESSTLSVEKYSFIDILSKKILLDRLNRIKNGCLFLTEGSVTYSFGNPSDTLRTSIIIKNPTFYRKVILGGSLAFAEAYIKNIWECSDLTILFRIFLRNRSELNVKENIFRDIQLAFGKIFPRKWNHTRKDSKRNILAHYDLGNEFYSLFLDRTMTYSSGIFHDKSSTMEEASIEKLDRICRKLNISPDDHVLEIGTGWGSFALHAAENYGCRITTTTISDEQFQLAVSRIKEAGLEDRVTVLNADYRDLEGEYDKIVSIEMIEAVGHGQIPLFAKTLEKHLKPGGKTALQAITIRDQHYDKYRVSEDFIKRYIFPGGNLVSMSHWIESLKGNTSLALTGLEEIGLHYAETLKKWREEFFRNIDKVRSQGFSDDFTRMWDYYLTYCEGGFREKHIGTVQVVMEKPAF